MSKPKSKSKNSSKKSVLKPPAHKDYVTKAADGRIFFTVYVTKEQHALLTKYCEPRGIGVSTLMRTKALEVALP